MNNYRKILKFVAPLAFNDGLLKCNKLAKKLIRNKNDGGIERFLDLGCGDGKFTIEIAKFIGAKEVYGIEFVDEYITKAKKKGIRCNKSDLNLKWNFKDNFFDLVLSSQNIEHLHDTRIYLEECYRCLKPGGQLILLTENLSSWINIMALVLGWQPFSLTNINGWSLGNPLIWHLNEPRNQEFFEKYQATGVSGTVGHVRVLAVRGLKELLGKVGFKNVVIKTTGYLPLWGKISDIFCFIDRRHGQFLVTSAFK